MTDPAGSGEGTAAVPAARLTPKPAKVEGNDWRSLDTAPLERFEPCLRATVVLPYYQAPDALALTLAGLERQSYPRHLFEVIVVDDGSDPPLELSEPSPLDVRVIHQPDLGFGLARARNNGARAAQGDIVVFLDCDMIPAEEWLAAHARWHHAASDAMSIGFRRHLDVAGVSAGDVRTFSGTLDEMFAGRPWDRPEWIEFHMARTAELTSDDDDLFRVASGGNLGMSRDFYWEVGGNDESFTQWGAEDVEFGYRAVTLGALLVPERRALCWHQGEGATPSAEESRSLEQQRAKLSQLIAHHGFRSAKPGRSFTVPQYVVSVSTGEASADALLDTVEGLLGGDVHDLVVWIEQGQAAGEEEAHAAEIVRRLLGGDPRVRFGPRGGAPSAFPASQFHMFVQAGTPVAADLVSGLRKQLRAAECAAASQRDGSVATLVRARRLHRELRRGLDAESIDAATLAPRLLQRRAVPVPTGVPSLPDDGEAASGAPPAADGASAAPVSVPPELDEPDKPEPPRRRPRDIKSLPASTPAVIWESARAANHRRLPRLRKLGRIAAYAAAEARAVRSPGDAARLVRTVGGWALRATGWRLRWIAWQARKAALRLRWTALRLRAAARRSLRRAFWAALRLRAAARRSRRRAFWTALRLRAAARRSRRRAFWTALRLRAAARRSKHRAFWRARRGVHTARQGIHTARRGVHTARRGIHTARRGIRGRPRSTTRAAAYSLGPSIAACGPRSEAVFAAWRRLRTEPSVPAQVVLCDDGSLPSTWTPKAGADVISLDGMAPTAATPAFDAEQVNPANWPAALKRAAALGPKEALPAGHTASRRVNAANLARARRYHHIADVAAYHADAQARAGAVAAMAASGAVVRLCDGGVEVAGLLGARLLALLTDPRIETASDAEREALSVEMRREALRTHSLRARARQVCEAASVDVEPLPLVSVLLATRRPDRVAEAIAAVAAQAYPRIELVLAAHGNGFDHARLEALAADSGTDARVLAVPERLVLGEVLNEALEHSRGELVTKFDDDDFYGPEHIWDLVLAHEYSRASLVGKAAEYVYLEGADRTLRRFRGGAERSGSMLSLAGGAMLIARSDLDALVGWQSVPSGVDRALMEDVVTSGGRLYRTHGRGYLLVRHARGHTWEADDEYFLEQAVEVRDGCDLRFAGIV